ncbi:hypothetical protein [Pleomorphovibrio marinus]|uniref:hypothetical protein n=1 Tax=Pleomorphovibrio marinus TaxID=2164132 RepID=UPI000E0A9459|nr:hypothetical protein [Pleomorphovibrio marinus]
MATALKKRLRKGPRKILRIGFILFLVLSFLQVAFYYGSDWFLREYIRNKVQEASGGKYTVDFERFNVSLLERGFYVKGFILDPVDEELFDLENKPFYRVVVPQFSLKGLGFKRSAKIVTVSELRLKEPMVQSRQPDEEEEMDSEDLSPLRQLELEVQRSFGEGLNDIIIENIYVDEADLLLENFISQRSIKAANTNLYVKNLKLAQTDQPIPFNADGFSFDLRNFEMLLADSIHTVSAFSVNISSLEKTISVDRVSILPDVTKFSDVYYEIDLDNIALTDADIDKMFYTSDVAIGELNLEEPSFALFSDRTVDSSQDTVRTTDLHILIQDILSSISIQRLNINSGKYLQRGITDANRNRVEAEEIDFLMSDVYIGPDELRKQNQFFYADEAELDITSARLALADGVHWVSGEKIFLSSFQDIVSIQQLSIRPEFDANDPPDIPLFEVVVPSLSFTQANLKKIYNENIIDISDMNINSPELILRDLRGREEQAGAGDFINLTREYLKGIYVQRLEMNDGSLVLDNHLRIRQDSLSFGKISLVLENFQLDEEMIDQQPDKIFFADELRLDIQDYALKLSDNLHLFSAKRILIDTRENLIDIDGFHLRPFSAGDVPTILQRYGRTTVLDIEIPSFRARGVDISKAYFEENLRISHIDIPSPIIQWRKYIQKEEEEETIRVERGDILNLLTSYFSKVQVDSLTLTDGSFSYDNFANETFRSFAENDVSIRIKNFYLDEFIDPQDNRTLFAEEMDLNLNNYVFNIADGKYSVVADRITFNSAREEINTINVRLRPRQNLDAKVAIQADIPDMQIKGVDLEAFLFDNTLDLEKLMLKDAYVKLSINRDSQIELQGEEQREERRRERNLPKTIDVVAVDSILTENARFEIVYDEDGEEVQLIRTGINLTFSEFLLDSLKLQEGDIAGFFENMAMEVDNFSLALQDSVHTLNFSKIELSTRGDDVVFENVKLTPNNFIGKKGVPIVAASIPKVLLNTRSLRTFQQTGHFDVTSLTLEKPEVTFYLDKNEVATIITEEEEEKARQKIIQTLNLRQFEIIGGQLSIREKVNEQEINSFQNIGITLTDLNFDLSKEQTFDSKLLLNNDYQFELTEYEIMLPDSLNIFRVEKVILSKDQLELEEVSLLPRFGKYEYGRKVGKETDVAELVVPRIVFAGIDVDQFIGEKKIIAKSMNIESPVGSIFRDKRLPKDEDKVKPMPQQLMMDVKMDVNVDEINIENGKVTYEEFPEKGLVPGKISFHEINAKMSPIHLGEEMQNGEVVRIRASSKLNGIAQLNINLEMLFEPPYPIKVEASVDTFELALINSILETNAFVTVERGVIKGGEWYFTANEERAIGEMTLKYNDLKVRLLDERTLERGRGRKGVLTFVINALALRSNNPRKIFNRLVSSPIYETRDTNRFVFNYLWKATFSGLAGSSGLMQPKIPRKEEEDQ